MESTPQHNAHVYVSICQSFIDRTPMTRDLAIYIGSRRSNTRRTCGIAIQFSVSSLLHKFALLSSHLSHRVHRLFAHSVPAIVQKILSQHSSPYSINMQFKLFSLALLATAATAAPSPRRAAGICPAGTTPECCELSAAGVIATTC